MGLVDYHRQNCCINQRVDYDCQVKHQCTGTVYTGVDNEAQFAYAEIFQLFGAVYAQDILTTAGTAVFQCKADTPACDNTADQACCQTVFDDWYFRAFQQRQ